MKNNNDQEVLTQGRLKELLHYNYETGVFTWRVKRMPRISAGDIAISYHPSGYLQTGIDGKRYLQHRLAFLYMLGRFPLNHVDHINHIRNDNRWRNIRESDYKMNAKNQRMYSNNTSGCTGVIWHRNRWEAQMRINGVSVYIGVFKNKENAIKARKKAEIKHGFHENHGEVAL